jgi:hypothetical protein
VKNVLKKNLIQIKKTMSDSFKHNPVFKDRNPFMKKLANKNLRKKGLEEVPNGKGYKKLFDSWSISDYKFRETLKERIEIAQRLKYEEEGRYLNQIELDKVINEWGKYFKRK